MSNLAELAATLRGLHKQGDPLLLANAWDVASARLTEEAGFAAVATSSSAIAHAFGHEDNDTMPLEVAFGTVERIAAAVSVPVTADLEAGYQLEPRDFIERLLAAGAVGFNFEDGDHHGGAKLVDMEHQAGRIRGLREAAAKAGVDVVINARVDVYVRHIGEPDVQLSEGLKRAQAYFAAGADCVYPIMIKDDRAIGEFVERAGGPVNVMLRADTPKLGRLRELGVARVSLGGGLARLALTTARQAADAMRAGTLFEG
jgi:2-methylisocitrate lyase-like PEP mutase family enzyme